jgi:hypothetical protein
MGREICIKHLLSFLSFFMNAAHISFVVNVTKYFSITIKAGEQGKQEPNKK